MPQNQPQKTAQPQAFIDDFKDNANGWSVGANDHCDLQIANGKLMMQGKTLNSMVYITGLDLGLNGNADYSISVNTTYLSGNKRPNYGLCWGADFQNNYSFTVSPNGYFTLGRRYFGTYKPLIPVQSYSPDKDVNARLKVQKKGDKLILFINDQEIKQVDYEPMDVRKIGFEVGGNQKIMFDDLTVAGQNLSLSANALVVNQTPIDSDKPIPGGQKAPRLNSLEGVWVAPDRIEGTFTGVQAQQLIYGINGNVEFLKR